MVTSNPKSFPLQLRGDRVRFLDEQDGPHERVLKDRLVEVFRGEPEIKRAYLARAGHGRGIHAVLGLRADGIDHKRLSDRVASIFASLFHAREHLDVMFVNAAHEAPLRKACKPFFEQD
jgi:type III secretion system (T3SS) SseB-like protein